ncbi:MauE/DoxX family redox-associated membrane protein [Sphingobacterium sp.]|uniref:MauE/DoxX family redox-associated membrane protein n=1 Tax=Sphingobacterium sp. TaxID=341027 RepID=UPI0031DF0803
MNRKQTYYITYKLLRGAMLLFWLYAGLDKIWQLAAFRIALQQQPVIGFLAPILFWLLPVIEIGTGVLLALPVGRLQRWGWRSCTLLILVFTIYIGLGVLDVYAQKPCMCTSFLSQISWGTHLLINVGLLALSLIGLLLHRSLAAADSSTSGDRASMLPIIWIILLASAAFGHIRSCHNKNQNLWYISDSLSIPAYDSVSRPIVGSLAYRYDRYIGRYRQLFTNGVQASTFTHQLLACMTERRIAIC